MEDKMLEPDPFNLQRFVDAQIHAYAAACAELGRGEKVGHWMWFIFPQLKGLGASQMAWYYGISGIDEAKAYVSHAVLGPRLRECTKLVNALDGRVIEEIFPYPDDLKFFSSMTLFSNSVANNKDFVLALGKYFAGNVDRATLALLGSGAGSSRGTEGS